MWAKNRAHVVAHSSLSGNILCWLTRTDLWHFWHWVWLWSRLSSVHTFIKLWNRNSVLFPVTPSCWCVSDKIPHMSFLNVIISVRSSSDCSVCVCVSDFSNVISKSEIKALAEADEQEVVAEVQVSLRCWCQTCSCWNVKLFCFSRCHQSVLGIKWTSDSCLCLGNNIDWKAVCFSGHSDTKLNACSRCWRVSLCVCRSFMEISSLWILTCSPSTCTESPGWETAKCFCLKPPEVKGLNMTRPSEE